jgi:hypothetical protein
MVAGANRGVSFTAIRPDAVLSVVLVGPIGGLAGFSGTRTVEQLRVRNDLLLPQESQVMNQICGWIQSGRLVSVLRRVSVSVPDGGEHVIVVAGVNDDSDPNLFQIAGTVDAQRPLLGFAQCRQEHGCQNGDDGNDDEQFNQGEGASGWLCPFMRGNAPGKENRKIFAHGCDGIKDYDFNVAPLLLHTMGAVAFTVEKNAPLRRWQLEFSGQPI